MTMTIAPTWTYDDGGRATSGRQGSARDCVVRAIAIAGRLDYAAVYDEVAARQAALGKSRSARNGVAPKAYKPLLAEFGWEWTPTMGIGTGCTVHLRADELPSGRLICNVSKHLVAVIDGVVHDTHDSTRGGTRCVYGYWTVPA